MASSCTRVFAASDVRKISRIRCPLHKVWISPDHCVQVRFVRAAALDGARKDWLEHREMKCMCLFSFTITSRRHPIGVTLLAGNALLYLYRTPPTAVRATFRASVVVEHFLCTQNRPVKLPFSKRKARPSFYNLFRFAEQVKATAQ